MRTTLTQGSIIEDTRSEKYVNIRCKGIVITARCDIANRKVQNIHYLTALSIEDWLYEVFVPEILEKQRRNILGSIKGFASSHKLDYKTLIDMGYEKAAFVMESSTTKQREKENVKLWVDAWRQCDSNISSVMTKEQKQVILKKHGTSNLKSKLTSLYNCNCPKYCFIPACAYTGDSSKTEGLVVDLQDIHQISMKESWDILDNKYDYKDIRDQEKREHINQKFFFEDEEDFVMIDCTVRPPWIERLLQEFTYLFSRIGLDNAEEEEIEAYCKELLGEGI